MKNETPSRSVIASAACFLLIATAFLTAGCDLGTYSKRLKQHQAGEKPTVEVTAEPAEEAESEAEE